MAPESQGRARCAAECRWELRQAALPCKLCLLLTGLPRGLVLTHGSRALPRTALVTVCECPDLCVPFVAGSQPLVQRSQDRADGFRGDGSDRHSCMAGASPAAGNRRALRTHLITIYPISTWNE